MDGLVRTRDELGRSKAPTRLSPSCHLGKGPKQRTCGPECGAPPALTQVARARGRMRLHGRDDGREPHPAG
eukprot:4887141-Pyramimonas_sp.AAC.1